MNFIRKTLNFTILFLSVLLMLGYVDDAIILFPMLAALNFLNAWELRQNKKGESVISLLTGLVVSFVFIQIKFF